MMRRCFLILLIAVIGLELHAQNGGAWVRQYNNTTIQDILPIKTIQQDAQGVMYFSNKQGDRVKYNGVSWSEAVSSDFTSEAPISVYKKAVRLLGDSVASVFALAKGQWMVALQDGRLFKGTVARLDSFPSAASEYLHSFGTSCGLVLANKQIAIATQQGGVVLINASTGAIEDIISYQTDLNDDRITALGADSFGGLWIATAMGLNRVAIDLPIRNFSVYPGIEGMITDMLRYNDTLYVSTTKGLYRLVPTRVVEQVMPYIKREMRHKEQVTYIRSTKEISKLVRISFVNKTDNAAKSISQEIPIKIEIPFDSVVNNYGLEFPTMDARRLYAKNNLAWRFEKITALLGEGRHLLVADSSLLVACSDGLYEVKDQTVHQIIGSESISGVALLDNNVLVTVGGIGLSSFVKHGSQWQKMTDNITVQGTCSFIGTTAADQLWVTTEKAQYRVKVDTAGVFGAVETFSSVNLQNPVLLQNNPLQVVCTGKGTYSFDEKKACFVLKAPSAVTLISNQLGYVWQNIGNRWSTKNSDVDSSQSRLLSFLSPQLLYHNQDLWTISGGEVFRIAARYKEPSAVVYLSSAVDRNGKNVLGASIELSKHNNGLSFSWASNWFVSEDKTVYRYRIMGLDSRWSKWSDVPSVTYPFIPAGNYSIELQARTASGMVITSAQVRLSVHGDFLAQYGLYLLVGVLFALSFVLLILLLRKKK